MSQRFAADIGGTFTDIVHHDEVSGHYKVTKILTNSQNPERAVLDGVEAVAESLPKIRFAVHGTTVGVNTFLQRSGTSVLLLTTMGFRDLYHMGRGDRSTLYALHYHRPRPLVPLSDVIEIRERLSSSGSVVEPLDEDDLLKAARRLVDGGYGAVAIMFLFSYLNPDHELRAERLLLREAPGVPISVSHRVAAMWQEYERTSSTVLDAYVGGPVRQYLANLELEGRSRKLGADFHIMQSNGGILSLGAARDRPLQTLFSGPVGGVMGAIRLAQTLDDHIVCADMGGTSFDVSLVANGRPDVAAEINLEGLPVLVPAVGIHSIGSGGGSIGWIEAGGLRVGPASAGANPGPACYGKGGVDPTVTDANVVLGRIDPKYFLGGEMSLDAAAAARALAGLGARLDLDAVTTAEGMITISNAKMAQAIRAITVERGIDPTAVTLLAYGGAGPTHAAFIAQELGIRRVVVPLFPGTFSAWGMLQAPVRHDLHAMFTFQSQALDRLSMESVLLELEARGRSLLETEGVSPESTTLHRAAALRYVGQEYTVEVDLDGLDLTGHDVDSELGERFHRVYRARYGHSNPSEPFEGVMVHVVAVGALDAASGGSALPETSTNVTVRSTPVVNRRAYFSGKWMRTQVVMRADLRPGAQLLGPVVVQEPTTTTVVPPLWSITTTGNGSLVLSPGDK